MKIKWNIEELLVNWEFLFCSWNKTVGCSKIYRCDSIFQKPIIISVIQKTGHLNKIKEKMAWVQSKVIFFVYSHHLNKSIFLISQASLNFETSYYFEFIVFSFPNVKSHCCVCYKMWKIFFSWSLHMVSLYTFS